MLATSGLFADPVKSGPQAGEKVPGPFRPLHVTGPDAGQRVCLYCKYGARPVALVITREMTPAVASLLAKLDAATAERQEARLASFTVFLGDPDNLKGPVKQLAEKHTIRHDILTVDETAPESYEIAADAAVTVILYRQHKVKANRAYRAGELKDQTIQAILSDLNAMVPPG